MRSELRWRRWALPFSGAAALAAAAAVTLLIARDDGSSPVTPNSLASITFDGIVKDVAPVGADPAAVDVDGSNVWVANAGEATISRVAMATRETETVPLAAAADDVVVTAVGVWIAARGELRRIDPATATPVARICVPVRMPDARASLAFAYTSLWHATGESLGAFDPVSGAAKASIPIGDVATDVTTGDGSVWVRSRSGVLHRVDPVTGDVVATVRLASSGDGSSVAAFGSIWTTVSGADVVQRVGFVDNAVTATIEVGERPRGIAAAPDAVWVANAGDGTISEIDPYANEVTATFDIGNAPTALVVAADRLWVAVQKR